MTIQKPKITNLHMVENSDNRQGDIAILATPSEADKYSFNFVFQILFVKPNAKYNISITMQKDSEIIYDFLNQITINPSFLDDRKYLYDGYYAANFNVNTEKIITKLGLTTVFITLRDDNDNLIDESKVHFFTKLDSAISKQQK